MTKQSNPATHGALSSPKSNDETGVAQEIAEKRSRFKPENWEFIEKHAHQFTAADWEIIARRAFESRSFWLSQMHAYREEALGGIDLAQFLYGVIHEWEALFAEVLSKIRGHPATSEFVRKAEALSARQRARAQKPRRQTADLREYPPSFYLAKLHAYEKQYGTKRGFMKLTAEEWNVSATTLRKYMRLEKAAGAARKRK